MASIAELRDLVGALVESAREKQKLEKVTDEIASFLDLLKRSKELRSSLTNTVFDDDERRRIISDICDESNFEDITKNFILLTLEFDCFNELYSKRSVIVDRLKKAAGKIQAHIITATSLSDSELETIKNTISGSTGKDVEIETSVDPSLIAGMIAKVENNVFDNSVRSRLNKIKSVLSPW